MTIDGVVAWDDGRKFEPKRERTRVTIRGKEYDIEHAGFLSSGVFYADGYALDGTPVLFVGSTEGGIEGAIVMPDLMKMVGW